MSKHARRPAQSGVWCEVGASYSGRRLGTGTPVMDTTIALSPETYVYARCDTSGDHGQPLNRLPIMRQVVVQQNLCERSRAPRQSSIVNVSDEAHSCIRNEEINLNLAFDAFRHWTCPLLF
jgi:hypothetical protein